MVELDLNMKIDLSKFSEKAANIITEKNKYWEHFLFIQLLDEDLFLAKSALRDEDYIIENSYYRFSNLIKNNYLPEIKKSLHEGISYAKSSRLDFDANYNPKNNADAFGPPGCPGDPVKIKVFSRRYAADYYECRYRHIELKAIFYAIDNFYFDLKNDDELAVSIAAHSEICIGLVKLFESQIVFMDGFGLHIRNAIDASNSGRAHGAVDWNETDESPASIRERLRLEFNALHFKNEDQAYYFRTNEYQPTNKPILLSTIAAAQTQEEVLAWLSTQNSISLADLRQKLLPLGLMPSALINDVNERAFQIVGVPALEESTDIVSVQRAVLLQVLAIW